MLEVQNEEKLISLEEAAKYLNLSSRAVKLLVNRGQITAYRLAGKHLRFKKSQLLDWQHKFAHIESAEPVSEPNLMEKIKDFFYFYDFYIFSLILIVLILYIIFRF